jgi:hypothetical protein
MNIVYIVGVVVVIVVVAGFLGLHLGAHSCPASRWSRILRAGSALRRLSSRSEILPRQLPSIQRAVALHRAAQQSRP